MEGPSWILWEELTWPCCDDEEERGRAQTVQVVPGGSDTLLGKRTGFRQLCRRDSQTRCPKKEYSEIPLMAGPSCAPLSQEAVLPQGCFALMLNIPMSTCRSLSLLHLVRSTFIYSQSVSSHQPPFSEIIVSACAGHIEVGKFAQNAELVNSCNHSEGFSNSTCNLHVGRWCFPSLLLAGKS